MISVSHCCWRMELLVALFLTGGKTVSAPEAVPVIWEGSIADGGEGGISHPRLCADAGERSGGSGEDSLQYFSTY
jgi:hypothetical protein